MPVRWMFVAAAQVVPKQKHASNVETQGRVSRVRDSRTRSIRKRYSPGANEPPRSVIARRSRCRNRRTAELATSLVLCGLHAAGLTLTLIWYSVSNSGLLIISARACRAVAKRTVLDQPDSKQLQVESRAPEA